ncbi:MAG: hypothetical protein J0H22_16600 [Actinobacteria bacterium]|nr:hypothetical protein [Actinomycetota bacterium]
MFDAWAWQTCGYRTLIPVDRPVWINTARAFPLAGTRRDQLPPWIKSGGLHLPPWMPARQTAWLRRDDGQWLAHVVFGAASSNGLSRLTMSLWLLADDINTDRQT